MASGNNPIAGKYITSTVWVFNTQRDVKNFQEQYPGQNLIYKSVKDFEPNSFIAWPANSPTPVRFPNIMVNSSIPSTPIITPYPVTGNGSNPVTGNGSIPNYSSQSQPVGDFVGDLTAPGGKGSWLLLGGIGLAAWWFLSKKK